MVWRWTRLPPQQELQAPPMAERSPKLRNYVVARKNKGRSMDAEKKRMRIIGLKVEGDDGTAGRVASAS